MPITATHIPSPLLSAIGRYATQADLESFFGTDNIRLWSNLANDSLDADVSRIQLAIDHAEAQVDLRLAGGPYAIPIQLNSGSILLRHWVAILAGLFLRVSRGDLDPDNSSSSYADLRQSVLRQLASVRSGALVLPAVRLSTTPTSPIVTPW